MTKPISLLFAASMLFTFACDAGEDPVVEDRAAELSETTPAPDVTNGHHAKRHGDRSKFAADKLCAEVGCSDEQAARIDELFASRHADRDPAAREAHEAARAETNKAIALAFAADEFDPAVLERAKPEHDGASHDDQMIALVAGVHGILTPEQRATLADKLESGGGMLFGHHGKAKHGKHGKHGKRQEGAAERDPSERLAAKVDGLCERVTCTEDQKTQLTATFEGIHEARRDAREDAGDRKPNLQPIADAFRADTLNQDALRQAMAAVKREHLSHKADRGQQIGAVVSEIHEILTPAQRAILAKEIEANGVRVLLGKRGDKHHGKRGGKHHGKRGDKRHGPGEVAAG
jgi:Spy/CpxP family protein refolding chaperone